MNNKETVKKYLIGKQPMTAAEIADDIGASHDRVSYSLGALYKEGL